MSATTVETKHHYRKACDPFTGVQVRRGACLYTDMGYGSFL